MTQHKITFLTDVSQVEIDDACGMKYWLQTLEGGVGIANRYTRIPNAIVSQTLDDLRTLSKMEDISEDTITSMVEAILDPLTRADHEDERKMELLYRRLGWFAAYALYMEPFIRTIYKTEPIADEIILDRDPLWVVVHPGRVLRSLSSDEVIYREIALMPPTLWNRKWLQSWHFNMKMHVGIQAVEEEIKEPVAYGQVMGMSEGYKSLTNERLIHPYVWGYYNTKSGQWSHAFKTGEEWVQKPVWEYAGGVIQWVKLCGKELADHQFQLSPPINSNSDILNEWVGRRVHRERQIKTMADSCHINTHLRAIHFPRRTAQCRPIVGEPCEFLKACWGDKKTVAMPMTNEEFVPNIPLQLIAGGRDEEKEGIVEGVVG